MRMHTRNYETSECNLRLLTRLVSDIKTLSLIQVHAMQGFGIPSFGESTIHSKAASTLVVKLFEFPLCAFNQSSCAACSPRDSMVLTLTLSALENGTLTTLWSAHKSAAQHYHRLDRVQALSNLFGIEDRRYDLGFGRADVRFYRRKKRKQTIAFLSNRS